MKRHDILTYITFCVLNVVDLLSTKYALLHGAVEANPFMAYFIGCGWEWAALCKVVACLFGFVFVIRKRSAILASVTLLYALVVMNTIINLMYLS